MNKKYNHSNLKLINTIKPMIKMKELKDMASNNTKIQENKLIICNNNFLN